MEDLKKIAERVASRTKGRNYDDIKTIDRLRDKAKKRLKPFYKKALEGDASEFVNELNKQVAQILDLKELPFVDIGPPKDLIEAMKFYRDSDKVLYILKESLVTTSDNEEYEQNVRLNLLHHFFLS